MLTTYKDISVRRRLEQEVIDICEWERQRIGRDLHDSIGQQLVGMGFLLSALSSRLESAGSPEAPSVEKLVRSCAEAHHVMRRIVRGLVPCILQDGLSKALEVQVSDIRVSMGLDCAFTDSLGSVPLPLLTVRHLYCLVQEAVANAMRHGRASRVRLSLERRGDQGAVVIEDNGSGFDFSREVRAGSGLNIMRYRADLVKGSLAFAPSELGGVRVTCLFTLGDAGLT